MKQVELVSLSRTKTPGVHILDSGSGVIPRCREGGFTLIESLITISLLTVVVVAGVSSTTLLQQSSKRTAQQTTAMELAQGQLDEFLAKPYNPPKAPYGPGTYTQSNYVMVTEAPGGSAPYKTSTGDGTTTPTTPTVELSAGGYTPTELAAGLKAATTVLVSAEKAVGDAQDDYDDQLDNYQSALEGYQKAVAEYAAKPTDTKKRDAVVKKMATLTTEKTKLAVEEEAVASATVAMDAAENKVAFWQNGGVEPGTQSAPVEVAIAYVKPNTTPAAISGGATMASVITTTEPVENGHVVTVVVEFPNHNHDSSIRLQTLVNKHAGGQPKTGSSSVGDEKKKK